MAIAKILPSLILPVFLLVTIYFLLYLPQKKREKKISDVIGALKEGNKIVTIGGICGKVISIDGDDIIIQSGEGTKINLKKWAIKESE